MDFTIESLEASKNATFDVDVGTRDDGAKVGFRIVGPSSDQFEAADREIATAALADARKRGGADELDEAATENVARRRDIIARHCLVGFYGFSINGQAAEFNAENVERILKARPNWKSLIVGAVANEGNFSTG